MYHSYILTYIQLWKWSIIFWSICFTCGTHLGETKLVTSMAGRPVPDSMSINLIFVSVGTTLWNKKQLVIRDANLNKTFQVRYIQAGFWAPLTQGVEFSGGGGGGRLIKWNLELKFGSWLLPNSKSKLCLAVVCHIMINNYMYIIWRKVRNRHS